MRKVTKNAVNAFLFGKNFSQDNTDVKAIRQDGFNLVYLRLHNHVIAERMVNSDEVYITNAGYFTATTKERLNGIPGVSIQQKNKVWYLNDKEWDGDWIAVDMGP